MRCSGVFRNAEARLTLDEALRREQDLDPEVIERVEQALIGGGMDDPAAVPDVVARAERHFERARRGEVHDSRMLAALAAVAAYTSRSAAEAADLAHRALLVSAKTIESQLSAAYTKLSIASRHELRGALEKVASQ